MRAPRAHPERVASMRTEACSACFGAAQLR
jgi:hypothetical protein